jgi:hypothetical protein
MTPAFTAERLELWIARSCGRPLDITIYYPRQNRWSHSDDQAPEAKYIDVNRILAALRPYQHRWRSICVYQAHPEDEDCLRKTTELLRLMNAEDHPLLEGYTAEMNRYSDDWVCWPYFEVTAHFRENNGSLSICNFIPDWTAFSTSGLKKLELVDLCHGPSLLVLIQICNSNPQLESLTIAKMTQFFSTSCHDLYEAHSSPDATSISSLSLPSLLNLTLDVDPVEGLLKILLCLNAPKLQRLTLSSSQAINCRGEMSHSLSKRKHTLKLPTLTSFEFHVDLANPDNLNLNAVFSVLDSAPTITRLVLRGQSTSMATEMFLHYLTQQEGCITICPELTTLSIEDKDCTPAVKEKFGKKRPNVDLRQF